MYAYNCSKTYHYLGPVSYRQWRAESHCRLIHGYALSFNFEFGSDELDIRNWVVDFGGLKPLKDLLEDWFDHTLLVAADDPHHDVLVGLGKLGIAKIVEVEATGCEALSAFLYKYLNDPHDGFLKNLGYSFVWCTKVEVIETPSNKGWISGDRSTWEKLT